MISTIFEKLPKAYLVDQNPELAGNLVEARGKTRHGSGEIGGYPGQVRIDGVADEEGD